MLNLHLLSLERHYETPACWEEEVGSCLSEWLDVGEEEVGSCLSERLDVGEEEVGHCFSLLCRSDGCRIQQRRKLKLVPVTRSPMGLSTLVFWGVCC